MAAERNSKAHSVCSCTRRDSNVSFEMILNNFPSNIAGYIRPSNVLDLLMKNKLPAVLMLLSFFGQWAMAQATGSIQGHVTDSSDTPIFGAVVTVQGAD